VSSQVNESHKFNTLEFGIQNQQNLKNENMKSLKNLILEVKEYGAGGENTLAEVVKRFTGFNEVTEDNNLKVQQFLLFKDGTPGEFLKWYIENKDKKAKGVLVMKRDSYNNSNAFNCAIDLYLDGEKTSKVMLSPRNGMVIF
jgi:inosine/xanthosine triphosphate pyrophosphatase family protein